ncbi:unnamed protein product [Leptidea sinapis]|uniref:Secreted protein n=1 Tax=Leptidea sinapis TaxID=189913 RepID=A0A5E4PKC6_9NEOP|nr:unnamed protein product [Leptidea sinapis]
MIAKLLVVFCILVKSAVSHGLSFPPHFKFGDHTTGDVACNSHELKQSWCYVLPQINRRITQARDRTCDNHVPFRFASNTSRSRWLVESTNC